MKPYDSNYTGRFLRQLPRYHALEAYGVPSWGDRAVAAVAVILFLFIVLGLLGCSTFVKEGHAWEWDERERGWFYKADRTVECIVMAPDGAYCHEYARTASFKPTYNELRPY